MNVEGSQTVQYEVGADGGVYRKVSQFCGGNWVVLAEKPVAPTVAAFRERYPDAKIANLVEQTVVRPIEVNVAQKIKVMSDDELAALGLQRVQPAPVASESAGTRIPQDFPGDFALRRAGHTLESVRDLTRDQLIEIEGIGPATADKIIARLAE